MMNDPVNTARLHLFFLGQAVAILGLTGCHPAAQQAPPAPPPPPVTVSHPIAKPIVDYDEFTARVAAVSSVDIRARVSGYLEKINFKDGQEVKKGDLLFVIDPRPYKAEVDRAQADLDKAQSQLNLADNDSKRAQGLFQNKAISAEELDTRSKTTEGAGSAVKSAQAEMETAQLNLSFTNVTAPIDGQLSRTMITEGNLVAADTTTLTTLVSVDPVYAYADVDEATVVKYQELAATGERKSARNGPIPASLAIGASTDFSHKGVIDFVNNQIDAGTGTLNARGVFANPDRTLIPGEFGRLRVEGSGHYTGLLVPDYAIGNDQEKKIVYVVGPDKTIATKQVTLGAVQDGLRVIRTGLDAGDWVVLDRLQILRPGMPVAPNEQPLKIDAGDNAMAPVTAHP